MSETELLAQALAALESLSRTAYLVKCQADNSGKTPYTDWGCATADLNDQLSAARQVIDAIAASRQTTH